MREGKRVALVATLLGGAILVWGLLLLDLPLMRPAVALLLLLQVVILLALLYRPEKLEEEVPDGLAESLSAILDTPLRIGDETWAHLRHGLTTSSAQKICQIIHQIAEVDAVAITDDHQILGFFGVGCRRHGQGGPILTDATRHVLETGETTFVTDPRVLSCDALDCPHPLKSAVIAPLKYRGKVIGTFKLYRTSPRPMPAYIGRLAVSIAVLLGLQAESSEADRQRQMVTRSRLEALQAQIRPHFLFNVLNTIIMFSRTDVERSRELLITLAQFFRRSLGRRGDFITLQDELAYIDTYLSLEKARFGEKLQIRRQIDGDLLGLQVPVLTLQPLVENAVVHGLAPKEEGGTVTISVRRRGDQLQMLIADDGVGVDPERVRLILQEGEGEGMGVGLSNVHERLLSLYGERHRLQIRSRVGKGTVIRVCLPILNIGKEEESPYAAQGADRR